MAWQDLLKNKEDTWSLPWTGGQFIYMGHRKWRLKDLPEEFGWYKISGPNKFAKIIESSDPDPNQLQDRVKGYLVGNRLVSDDTPAHSLKDDFFFKFETVYLIPPGLDKFARVSAGRTFSGGHLIFLEEEFGLGPEEEVLNAFLDSKESVDDIAGVTPALDAAFKFETWCKGEVEKRRREDQERREREEARQRMEESLGNAVLRRQAAQTDFGAAAKAALAISGAVYLDHRRGHNNQEMIVRYRINHHRLECIVNEITLRVIDSGCCLTAEYDDENFEAGVRADTWLTLESLPAVILEADHLGRLNIYRRG